MDIKIAVIYHSGYGHTAKVAEAISKGVSEAGAELHLLKADVLSENDWAVLDNADAIIFGAPTYMAGVSAPFKAFIDATSKRWSERKWKDKIAAGFTNSSSYAGDKQTSIQQLFHFAMQHGMIWVGQEELAPTFGDNEILEPSAINRVGSYSGLMTQSNHKSSPELAPSSGDLETSKLFGKRIANITAKFAR